jgi:hypothetical protein
MGRKFNERIRTGSDLAKFCFAQVGEDKRLLVFPLVAGALICLLVFVYFAGLFIIPDPEALPEFVVILLLVLLAVVYIISYFIRVLLEAAMVAYAYERMEAGRSSFGKGISKASGRSGKLFKWAAISAIVGVLSNLSTSAGSDKRGKSRITRKDGSETEFTSVQAAWSAATYLALPLILYEDTEIMKLPSRSDRLVTEFWDDEMVGRLGVGILFILLFIPALFIFFVGLTMEGNLGLIIVIITVAYMIAISSIRGISGGVLSAALYRYTQTGNIDVKLPSWLRPKKTPISRGAAKVDEEIAAELKAEEVDKKDKKRAAIAEEGKSRYYARNGLGILFAAMFLLGILNLMVDGNIVNSLILWAIAVVIVVVMYSLGMIEVVDTSTGSQMPSSKPSSVIARPNPTIGSQVLVNTPEGSRFQGMVTGIESGFVSVRLKDGTERFVDESCCTQLD